MLPDHVLSSQILSAQFEFPRNIPRQSLIAYEYGGVGIQDASQGLRVKVWKGEYLNGAVTLSADGVAPVAVLTVADLTELAFTFDQNMNPFICWENGAGASFFYWFDSTIPGFTTTALPAGTTTPRCALDDNRPTQTGASDIILAYVRAGALYFRAQRDRYLIEYELDPDISGRSLMQIGMNKVLRFQFQLSTG